MPQVDGQTPKYKEVIILFFRLLTWLTSKSSLGDLQYKRFGITSEPDVRTKLLQGQPFRHFQPRPDNGLCHYAGNEWAFIVLVSDGISSVLSDQEIADLARDAPDPKSAANRVLSFSQDLGGDDNATAIVIPLAGWEIPCELDRTKELREYRLRQAGKYISYPPLHRNFDHQI